MGIHSAHILQVELAEFALDAYVVWKKERKAQRTAAKTWAWARAGLDSSTESWYPQKGLNDIALDSKYS